MAQRREPRPIIAYAACPFCSARCAHQRDTAGRVYAYCRGEHDAGGKACGSYWRFGVTHSENFVRKAEAARPPAPADKVTTDGRDGTAGSHAEAAQPKRSYNLLD